MHLIIQKKKNNGRLKGAEDKVWLKRRKRVNQDLITPQARQI